MAAVKHIFIINPAAGKCDRTNQVAASIRAAAMELGVDYEILTTEYPRHAVSQVRQKAEEYPDRPLRFYACGGDGTLNEVAAGAAGLPNVAITHYPTGSGNDFIKLFGADCRAFSDLKSLICGKELELDYMETDRGISLNVFSVGVDARIADGMQKYKRIPALQGKTAYNISTVENLLRGLSEPYEILVDGQRFEGKYCLVLAGNGRFYGGGANPVPEADPTDGLLDVLLVKDLSLLKASQVIGGYMSGRHSSYPQYITEFLATELTVRHRQGKNMTINLDGEIVHASEVTLRLAKDKLRFVIPQSAQLLPPRTAQ